jgi:hypothetical protein
VALGLILFIQLDFPSPGEQDPPFFDSIYVGLAE